MEVHTSIDPEVYRKVGPELYWDEFLNTVNYLFTDYPVTERHLKTMRENLSYVDDEIIKQCKNLREKRDVVFAVKRGEYRLKRKVQWRGYEFFIGKKLLMLHLFPNLKHNIICNVFRIGGLYVIDICVGKVK